MEPEINETKTIVKETQKFPVFNPSQPEEAYRINFQHLLMDSLILAFGYFLSDLLFSESGYYSFLENWQKLVIFNLAVMI